LGRTGEAAGFARDVLTAGYQRLTVRRVFDNTE
jgi:hypothetical protein